MNPALPLLVLLSVAGLFFRRREFALPWVACGLAGLALLAPALSLSDGIPSPAASLAEDAPWQGVVEAGAGNPNLRDITHQVEPWLVFLHRELRAGRLPYWDPHQFSGSPYWSNGSGAPLFPLHLLFALLPLQLGLVLLPWIRLVIGGCGAWFLARELGCGRPGALVAALVFPLSGMITGFLLFPMANCHALVPWVLLAVERLASGRGRWTTLAWLGGLQLLGGHPETPVFTALLAGIYLLVRGTGRPLRAWAGFLGAWIAALGLSAIQIVPLFVTLRETGKWLHHESAPPPPLATVGRLLLRLVLPDAFGNPAAGSWWGPYNFIGTALYVGAIPLLLALGGLAALGLRQRRAQGAGSEDVGGGASERRWWALAAMTGCALAGAYHLPGARQILLALPVIQRGIHHYLKLGVELGLALFAARGWELWSWEGEEGDRRSPSGGAPLLAGAIGVGALLALAWWRLGPDWRVHGLTAEQGLWTASALGAIALLGAGFYGPRWLRRALGPLALVLLVVDLCAAHAATNPGLSFSRFYPRTGAVRFLEGRPERFAGSGTTLYPDAAMVYGLYDVRGDSPVKLDRYDRVYGRFAAPDPVYFRPIRDWSSPWLDRLGVRWAVFGPQEEAPAGTAWRLAYAGPDAKVYERPTALPLARLEGAPKEAALRIERREPGLWRISWSGAGSGRLVVAETWDAGWRASTIAAAGHPARRLRVETEEEILLGVALPRPEGTLELRYRPPGIELGAGLTLASALLLAIVALRSRPLAHAAPLLLALGALLSGGCGDRSAPRGLDLRAEFARRVDDRSKAGGRSPSGLRFALAPELESVTIEGESRQAVVTTIAPWSWRGRPPAGATLRAGMQILPELWPRIEGLTSWAEAESGGERQILDVASCRVRGPQGWLELDADLATFAGRETRVTFHVEIAGLPAGLAHAPAIAWSPVKIDGPRDTEEGEGTARPNVLFVLVDTLRHDHLTPYGYRRDTSPNLERLLAARGVVAEEAYSQAPWTLPSVVSFLTSRYPGEVLGSDASAYGIPPGFPSLAEEMAKRGYETGGFFTNKILHAGNGFARGFATFYSPPADVPDDRAPDAAALVDHLAPWLRAHREGPFFLYAHFIDPHDPYDNPEIVSGRSPYFPDYKGGISGFHLQGLHTGKVVMKDPPNDLAQVNALYDSEVHYTDRFVGALLESLPPAVLRNTLVVLTADHGEEIYEHGGWKHGFTLYEEQIHVPLLLRWDGHLPAGRRLRGTVRLVDLAPTLLRAAGGTPPPSWEGVDLLPALSGRQALPRLTAFAQHMMIGPLRAAAIHDRAKLILFNPKTPFAPADGLQEHLWNLDLQRMKRIERLYDLASDPGEKSNLAGASRERANLPARIQRLQPAIHQQLDRQIPGLRLIAQGLPAGARVEGTLEIALAPPDSGSPGAAPPPITWQSYFLGEEDRVEVAGRQVRFELRGEALDKGFILQGGIAAMRGIARLEVTVDGRPLPPARLLLGGGAPASGGAIERSALVTEGWPSAGAAAGGVRIWIPRLRSGPIAGAGSNAETEKRLRALGYIQ